MLKRLILDAAAGPESKALHPEAAESAVPVEDHNRLRRRRLEMRELGH
jgi:hypothetical protein